MKIIVDRIPLHRKGIIKYRKIPVSLSITVPFKGSAPVHGPLQQLYDLSQCWLWMFGDYVIVSSPTSGLPSSALHGAQLGALTENSAPKLNQGKYRRHEDSLQKVEVFSSK